MSLVDSTSGSPQIEYLKKPLKRPRNEEFDEMQNQTSLHSPFQKFVTHSEQTHLHNSSPPQLHKSDRAVLAPAASPAPPATPSKKSRSLDPDMYSGTHETNQLAATIASYRSNNMVLMRTVTPPSIQFVYRGSYFEVRVDAIHNLVTKKPILNKTKEDLIRNTIIGHYLYKMFQFRIGEFAGDPEQMLLQKQIVMRYYPHQARDQDHTLVAPQLKELHKRMVEFWIQGINLVPDFRRENFCIVDNQLVLIDFGELPILNFKNESVIPHGVPPALLVTRPNTPQPSTPKKNLQKIRENLACEIRTIFSAVWKDNDVKLEILSHWWKVLSNATANKVVNCGVDTEIYEGILNELVKLMKEMSV